MAADASVDISDTAKQSSLDGRGAVGSGEATDVLVVRQRELPYPLPYQTMFGLPFSAMSLDDTLVEIGRRAATRHGTLVMTCNVDHVVMLSRNAEFAEAYAAADIVTVDGAPLVGLSRLLRRSLPERVTGADLVEALPSLAGPRNLRVALVGGADGVAAEAADTMASAVPGMPVPLALCPPMGFSVGSSADLEIIRQLQEYDPHVVVVCLGAPRQELWMHRHRADLPQAVLLGGGASLDFVVGIQRRAPRWVQKAGVEWVWRLSHDFPRLARRYLVQDARIVPLMLKELAGAITARTPVASD